MKDELKYETAGGNIVTWNRDPHRPNHPWGSYECGGCGDESGGIREHADKHAQNCRAL